MKSLCLVLAMMGLSAIAAAPAAAQVAPPAPAAASAPAPQKPWLEVYGGGAILFARPGSDLDRTLQPGAQVSLNVSPFVEREGWMSRLGFAVEVGGTRRTSTLDDALVPSAKVQLTETTLLAGPTFATLRRGRVTAQFRGLLGVARLRSTFPSDAESESDLNQAGIAPGQVPSSIGVFEDESAFAASIGSAWDIRVTRALAVRINQGSLITRFGSKTQFSPRVSTGIVFRWYGSQTPR
jgi:hypothetical protein